MTYPDDIRELRALSIRPPWTEAILHFGKDIENRSRRQSFRGRVLIHAGKTFEFADWNRLRRMHRDDLGSGLTTFPHFSDIPQGGIVGLATVVDCVEWPPSQWFYGPYGLVLEDVQELPFIPCNGMLGFFPPELPQELPVA